MTSAADQPFKVLIADDDNSTRRVLETRLSMQGFVVCSAANGAEALERFRGFEPDVVILDVMMPELDGFGVIERLRAISEVPIILLTALAEISDRITGLQLGADDYMLKPFSPRELEARIRCLLRRSNRQNSDLRSNPSASAATVVIGDLRVDLIRRQVHRNQDRIRLTGMEFSLLELLIQRAGDTIPRSEILETIWGYTPERVNDRRVVDVHISRLRAKLEADPDQPELILTARGQGYQFQRLVPQAVALAR